MNCKICGSDSKIILSGKIKNKYDINYHQCITCKFIQTDEPFWLEEAYKSPINIEDTGLVDRNILLAKRTGTLLYFLFNKKSAFLDFAAGYGLFVRLTRDYGFNFFWSDPYTENIFAKGFEFNPVANNKVELVTAFECFEHFSDPLKEIKKILEYSDNIIFSTEIFSGETPANDWDYFGFSHGQHIALYSYQTLKTIAETFNLNLNTNGKSFHLLTKKKISNVTFNFLLKLSLTGFPIFFKRMLGSKTLSDFNRMRSIRQDSL